MGGKRQKSQIHLASMQEGRGEAPTACMGGTEPPAAKRDTESPARMAQPDRTAVYGPVRTVV
jgi:hypothetical protein